MKNATPAQVKWAREQIAEWQRAIREGTPMRHIPEPGPTKPFWMWRKKR